MFFKNTSIKFLSQVGNDLVVTKATSGRSSDVSIQDFIENYIKSNDISFKLPIVGSTVTLAGRNLDNDELGFKLKFGSGSEVQGKIFLIVLIVYKYTNFCLNTYSFCSP